MKENSGKNVLQTILLIASAVIAIAAMVFASKMYLQADTIRNSITVTQEEQDKEIPIASDPEVASQKEETINWVFPDYGIRDLVHLIPDKIALHMDDGRYVVIPIPENNNYYLTLTPNDQAVRFGDSRSIRVLKEDPKQPDGFKRISDENEKLYIVGRKNIGSYCVLLNAEVSKKYEDGKMIMFNQMLDNIIVADTVHYSIIGMPINDSYLQNTTFGDDCIFYEGDRGNVIVQGANIELPMAGYNKAHRLENWIVYSGTYKDQESDNELFLIDVGERALKVVAPDIETLYDFFGQIYREENVYDASILGSDVLNILTTNNVGSLEGLNFFVPQEQPEYQKDEMVEIQLDEKHHSIDVGAGQKVWLDITGLTLDAARDGYAVLVQSGGELVITGDGTIMNTKGRTAILNEGKCFITGDVKIEAENGKFAVVNHGNMEISGNVQITGNETVECLIDNGYANKKSYDRTERNYNGINDKPTLKVYSGEFSSEKVALQNEEDGYAYIYGGDFSCNDGKYLVGNAGEMLEIVGGNYHSSDNIFWLGQKTPTEGCNGKTFVLGGKFDWVHGGIAYDRCIVFVSEELAESEEFKIIHGPCYILGGEFEKIESIYNIETDETSETPITISDKLYLFK